MEVDVRHSLAVDDRSENIYKAITEAKDVSVILDLFLHPPFDSKLLDLVYHTSECNLVD